MEQRRSKLVLVSVILSVLWMIVVSGTYGNTADSVSSSDSAESIGTALGLAMLMPFMLTGWVGTILNFAGHLARKRGLVLAGAIVMCVALVLGVTWGVGLIPSIVLSFIGYSRMMPKIQKEQ